MKIRAILRGFLLPALLMVVSCSDSKTPVAGAVLTPGQYVVAANKFGGVRISYVDAITRRYEWQNNSRVVTMKRRPEPFRGKVGMYNPNEGGLFDRKQRLLVQEHTINYETEKELYASLYEGSAVMDWVYTEDGLVVGYGIFPDRDQVNLELFQILLRGKKPTGLRGARPDSIRLGSVNDN